MKLKNRLKLETITKTCVFTTIIDTKKVVVQFVHKPPLKFSTYFLISFALTHSTSIPVVNFTVSAAQDSVFSAEDAIGKFVKGDFVSSPKFSFLGELSFLSLSSIDLGFDSAEGFFKALSRVLAKTTVEQCTNKPNKNFSITKA